MTGPRTARLQCTTCGARRRASPSLLRRGWYRCGHCTIVMSVPEAGTDTSEGVGRRFVKVRRGEAVLLTSAPGTLVSTRELGGFAMLLLLVGGGASVVSFAFAVDQGWPDLGLGIAIGFLALTMLAWLALLWLRLTSQHIQIAAGRIEAWREALGIRRSRVAGFCAELQVELVQGAHAVLELSTGTSSIALQGGLAECRWLRAQLEYLTQPGPRHQLACPGCGAPMGTYEQLLDADAIDCVHCETGLVLAERALAIGPARLPGSTWSAAPNPRVHAEHTDDADRWWFRSLSAATPVRIWLFWGVIVAIPAGICGLFVWVIAVVATRNDDMHGLIIVLLAGGLLAIGGVVVGALCELLLPHEIVIDRATVRMKGPLGFSGLTWQWDTQAIPLARIVELAFDATTGGPTTMHLRTPNGTVSWRWQLFTPEDDAWLRSAICRALETRLAVIGRSVTVR